MAERLNLNIDKSFTMEQALAIQEAHLMQWEVVLKPEVASKLRKKVLAQNKGVTDPYEVCRGTSIDQFVHNAMYHRLK